MQIRCAVACVAILAASANADIVHFDNAGGVFSWAESFDLNMQFHHGASLDLTLPPSQSGAQSPRGIMSYTEIFFTSTQFVRTQLAADFPGGVTVARGAQITITQGLQTLGTANPAITFASGQGIGPSAGGGGWNTEADVDWRAGTSSGSLIGGRAYVGVRLLLDDGFHYGWIDLIDNGYNSAPSFVAAAWAYETLPNTPIPAGAIPAPGTAGVFALLALPALRRRR